MSDDPVISVRSAGKTYRIWEDPSSRLLAPLMESTAGMLPTGMPLSRWLKAKAATQYRDFRALHDVSLTVKRGQAVGIVGRNGSGKSTLLQIISGTLQPTTGTVATKGRVAALLELGSGFNPEFTGRENVYLNGAVLGLSRGEMDQRFAAIAAFADIGDFINQPVRTYSSGMVVRLAFAVAAHVDPQILIVDEALSVGDARFQLKCARAIDRYIAQGVTLLFVSHDASMIKRLCSHAILLEGGQVLYAGRPNDVVNLYSKLLADGGSVEGLAADIAALQAPAASAPSVAETMHEPEPFQGARATPAAPPENQDLTLRLKAMETLLRSHPDSPALQHRLEQLLANERSHTVVTGQEFAYGGELGRIHTAEVLDADGQPRGWFSSGEIITVRLTVEASEALPEPIYALTIKNAAGVEIYGTNTLFSGQPAPAMTPGTPREVRFQFALNVMPGHYFLSLGFTHFVGQELVVIHRRYDAIKLEVHGLDRCFGIANLHAKITQIDQPAAAAG